MGFKKIFLKTFIVISILLIIIVIIDRNWERPVPPQTLNTLTKNISSMKIWDQIRKTDVPQIAPGWSSPVYLEVSDQNWGDSVSISPDGNTLYFMDYPGDLLSETLGLVTPKNVFEYNADIYKSQKPFLIKEKDSRFFFDEDPWSASGITEDEDGNFFYATNRFGENDGNFKTDIYRNSERLAFNIEEQGFGNPQYNKVKDELWFNKEGDFDIMVLKNAAESGFSGTPVLAPSPINVPGSKSAHPFLTADGNTMYFTSDRDEVWKRAIYKSIRLGENSWSTPEKIIWNSGQSVGEPTLPLDGSRLYYEQVFKDDKLGFTTLFFYIEKL